MGHLIGRGAWLLGAGMVVALLSACGSSDSSRKPRRDVIADGGTDGATVGPSPDAGDGAVRGPFQYVGTTVPAGGTIMTGGKYILFSVTGEVPGSSGLTHSTQYKMVGGIVGRAH